MASRAEWVAEKNAKVAMKMAEEAKTMTQAAETVADDVYDLAKEMATEASRLEQIVENAVPQQEGEQQRIAKEAAAEAEALFTEAIKKLDEAAEVRHAIHDPEAPDPAELAKEFSWVMKT